MSNHSTGRWRASYVAPGSEANSLLEDGDNFEVELQKGKGGRRFRLQFPRGERPVCEGDWVSTTALGSELRILNGKFDSGHVHAVTIVCIKDVSTPGATWRMWGQIEHAATGEVQLMHYTGYWHAEED
jgi:hypothetical protein